VRVKLDENLPHDLGEALRRHGHDVHTVVEEHLAGESDPVVVAAATPGSSSSDRLHKTQTASWPSSGV